MRYPRLLFGLTRNAGIEKWKSAPLNLVEKSKTFGSRKEEGTPINSVEKYVLTKLFLVTWKKHTRNELINFVENRDFSTMGSHFGSAVAKQPFWLTMEPPTGFPRYCGLGRCIESVPKPEWCAMRGCWRDLSADWSYRGSYFSMAAFLIAVWGLSWLPNGFCNL